MKKLALLLCISIGCIGYAVHEAFADDAPLTVSDVKIDGAPAIEFYPLRVATAEGSIDFRDDGTVFGGGPAWADRTPILLAQADTGSSAAPSSTPANGSAAEPAPIADPLTELAALKLKYDALKAARDSGSKDLLWFAYAALAAAFIRTLLSGIKAWRGDKPTGWVKWTALALAVPLALLTYYAAGAGLWAAIVMAGAGPGAILVNELLKKKAAPAS